MADDLWNRRAKVTTKGSLEDRKQNSEKQRERREGARMQKTSQKGGVERNLLRDSWKKYRKEKVWTNGTKWLSSRLRERKKVQTEEHQ